jgi:hypothetical protein
MGKNVSMGVSESEDAAVNAAFDAWRRRRRPANELPSTAALDVAVGTTDSLVVYISSLALYSNGIAFTVEARGRGGPGSDDRPVALDEGLWGTVPDVGLWGTVPPEHHMLLGVEFADGRRCIRTPRGQEADPADEPLLLFTGGGGSSGEASAEWFLSPFPPPGDLHLYCAWPAAGIPETTTVISANQLATAARQVQQLWPPSRAFDPQPDPTPVPLAPDGWF